MERVELNYFRTTDEMLKELAYQCAYKIYGNPLTKEIQERLDRELKSIIEYNYATLYLIAQRLVKRTNDDGYIVANRGAIGASLVAYCLGITEIDPIKYNIPFETFSGLNGEKEPDIALCVPYNYKQQLEECVEDKYLDRIAFRICESNIPVILYRLKELTGIDPTTIPLNDKETLKIICAGETSGIPEFDKARNIILETHPTTFDDLVKISGLLYGTNAWKNNAQELIKNGTTTLEGVIASRDDIINYLNSVGIDNETSYRIMELVYRGRASRNKWASEWKEFVKIMQGHNIPNWYIKSCEKIAYLFPKAHVVGSVINSFRIVWYKVHYKNEFNQVIKEFEE